MILRQPGSLARPLRAPRAGGDDPEITRDEAFPPRRTTVEELTGETPEPPRKTQPKPEPVEHVDTETGEILDEVLDGPMFAQEVAR